MSNNSQFNLKNEVIRIVSKVSRIKETEFEEGVLIREELGIDSLMGMEIIAHCEKALGIHIDESQFSSIETVGDFLQLVQGLYETKQA